MLDKIPSNTGTVRQQIKYILIGSASAVPVIIYTLYSLGYGSLNEWSTPQPTGNCGEVISMLIRYLLLD
ncbi:hypothetical protein LYNGBM3L_30550 [Moorena producens 3L]|uniref:Uncharacterized protein n=1 Tax=Moorena producens 3L TaxID=489825 RepID=F4XU59_9CYAN|nr:hypothetical protein LYNGBM3L_30550 [Moorena producens 3L]